MIRIAICDDDTSFCDLFGQMVKSYLQKNSIQAEIQTFFSGEELCGSLSDIDLIFLDIELTGMNGVDAGQLIRRTDNTAQIVYVSSKSEYAMQLFQNRPFDFLVKPVTQGRLNHLLDEYFRVFPQEDRFFSFTSERIKQQIPVNQIIYFESMRKQLKIVTGEQEFMTYYKLTDIMEYGFSRRFLRIHQSFLVNAQHIKTFRYNEILLTNGTSLPISRSYQNEVKQFLLDRRKGDRQ